MGNLCQSLGLDIPNDSSVWEHSNILPSGKHIATVIWLHGLGDSGHSWYKHVLTSGPIPGVKYIFPTAPFRPVTINGGITMPAWYDLYGLRPEDAEDELGISRSSQQLLQFIEREIASGIPPQRIALVGFSQGGAVALNTCYRISPFDLGGLVMMSSYVPLATSFPTECKIKTPTLVCHGDRDCMVPYEYGKRSHELLISCGIKSELKCYKGLAHGANEVELADVSRFLQTQFGTSKM